MEKDANGKVDPLNPFGASIKPGGQKGALNIINEEGDWDSWNKSLPSQFLSKQSLTFAKQQLNMKRTSVPATKNLVTSNNLQIL